MERSGGKGNSMPLIYMLTSWHLCFLSWTEMVPSATWTTWIIDLKTDEWLTVEKTLLLHLFLSLITQRTSEYILIVKNLNLTDNIEVPQSNHCHQLVWILQTFFNAFSCINAEISKNVCNMQIHKMFYIIYTKYKQYNKIEMPRIQDLMYCKYYSATRSFY